MKTYVDSDKSVLLIFPKTGLDLKSVNIQMPMGLMCIAVPLIEDRFKVDILDQRIERDFFEKVHYYLLENKPICVGISVMTGLQIMFALQIAKYIRDVSRVPIVFGGIHPTLLPDQTVQNEYVDVIVRGEGDITFYELVNAFYLKDSLQGIKGITWRDGKIIHNNAEREFCDLNKLSPIHYNLVDVESYIQSQVPGRKRSLDIYTSRGCPYGCIFCYNRSFNKSKYRQKNIDIVLKEIEFLVKKYSLDSIYINDDNFFLDIERAHYFCNKLINRKIVPAWGCQGARIDSLEKIDFWLLEKSGCKNIYVGIESGSEKILEYIKKQITMRQVKEIIEKFANSKIIAHYNFMVGYPTESIYELFETIELVDYIMRIDPKAYFSTLHLITPYPGTEFYEIIRQSGFEPPQRLEEWADIRWEFENAAWVPPKMRRIDLNLALLTYFIDRKGLYKTEDRILLKILTNILMILAKFHWKHRIFNFCPEFQLLNRLFNYKVKRQLKNLGNLL